MDLMSSNASLESSRSHANLTQVAFPLEMVDPRRLQCLVINEKNFQISTLKEDRKGENAPFSIFESFLNFLVLTIF